MRLLLFACLMALSLNAQTNGGEGLTDRERQLLQRIDRLENRIAALEKNAPATSVPQPASPAVSEPPVPKENPAPVAHSDPPPSPFAFHDGTTLNFGFDGYYGINTNNPSNRLNLLRTNDASSRSFSVGQVGVIVERTPTAEQNRRFGYRLDLMFGQNTEYLQGALANENRPNVYRNLFQAYGSYLVPLGKGLQVDFGKFASSLGAEGNYTKDQLNYSRSYFFAFLPFYHEGFRVTYPLTSHWTAQYWLVNGSGQTEDFNGFKSQAAILNWKPNGKVTWNANYYVGRESRQSPQTLSPAPAGTSTDFPNGRLHILDTYATLTFNPKWSATLEGDYVINRFTGQAPPARVWGGAAYLHHQLTSKFALNGRFTYLSDNNGLFSSTNNRLKEATITGVFQPTEGFQTRLEYRHDWASEPIFTTVNPAIVVPYQNTVTLGLIWWMGGKTQAW